MRKLIMLSVVMLFSVAVMAQNYDVSKLVDKVTIQTVGYDQFMKLKNMTQREKEELIAGILEKLSAPRERTTEQLAVRVKPIYCRDIDDLKDDIDKIINKQIPLGGNEIKSLLDNGILSGLLDCLYFKETKALVDMLCAIQDNLTAEQMFILNSVITELGYCPSDK